MRTDSQIEAAAAAAAEKANGGKFSDPLFYKPEHRAFWKEVIRAGLDAADALPLPKPGTPPSLTNKDVEDFSGHCVYIRSVYRFTMRIWRDSDENERKIMEAICPLFFEDIAQVLQDYVVIAACRITDAANDGRKNENFTAEMFVNSFSAKPEIFKKLDALHQRMRKLRSKVLPARNKLAAHADREAIRSGKPLGAASFQEWDDFWSALADFVRLLNEETIGSPFEIDAAGVLGDAEMLLKALRDSQYFETLLRTGDAPVKSACLKVAER
jgi:AbiU2